MDEDRQELLEIYKLHTELADRVSQRREGANRLFVSLLTGTLIFLVAFLRYGAENIPIHAILTAIGVFGVFLSASWYIVIRSYRQLNTGKFAALRELEEKLAYPCFTREWELLGGKKPEMKISRYWRLSVVETILPIIFAILYIAFIVIFFVICR